MLLEIETERTILRLINEDDLEHVAELNLELKILSSNALLTNKWLMLYRFFRTHCCFKTLHREYELGTADDNNRLS